VTKDEANLINAFFIAFDDLLLALEEERLTITEARKTMEQLKLLVDPLQ